MDASLLNEKLALPDLCSCFRVHFFDSVNDKGGLDMPRGQDVPADLQALPQGHPVGVFGVQPPQPKIKVSMPPFPGIFRRLDNVAATCRK